MENKALLKNWKPYLFFIVLTEAIGAIAGFLTRDGVEAFKGVPKSPLTPPDIVFPIVWTVLYLLMGIGMARVWISECKTRKASLIIFCVQLAMNFAWSFIFFNASAYGFALLWLIFLWMAVMWMILLFSDCDKPAALIQIPYLLWLTFAGYLNYTVWTLNM